MAVRLTLPLDVERIKTVRSGPSGSAAHTELHAQGRVAVLPTLPLGGERTGQRHPHCHLTSNVPKRYARLRVAVWVRAIHGPAGATPTLGRASSELSLERWAVSERGVPGFGPRRKDRAIRRTATPARDGPPASREIASPRPGDGGAPFPMRTGRPARAIPGLPPAAAPEEARCGPHELRYPRTWDCAPARRSRSGPPGRRCGSAIEG